MQITNGHYRAFEITFGLVDETSGQAIVQIVLHNARYKDQFEAIADETIRKIFAIPDDVIGCKGGGFSRTKATDAEWPGFAWSFMFSNLHRMTLFEFLSCIFKSIDALFNTMNENKETPKESSTTLN